MAKKVKKTFTRYDLPLDYFLEHKVYKRIYNILIPEHSNILHVADNEDIEIIDIYNDAKFYIDKVLTSKYPELEITKAYKKISDANNLHYDNLYYSYIVSLVFFIVVYNQTQHTDAMCQAVNCVQTLITSDAYFEGTHYNKGTLGYIIDRVCKTNLTEYIMHNKDVLDYSFNSPFFDIDKEYAESAEYFGTIEAYSEPMLTRIVEEHNKIKSEQTNNKDKRQKQELPQPVVMEILRQLCIKAGCKPEEVNNTDFSKFFKLITPYAESSLKTKFNFTNNKSLISDVPPSELTEVKEAIKKLGLDINLG